MRFYQKIAKLVQARLNCINNGNEIWESNHTEEIERLVKEHMPSGSGIDNGTKIDLYLCTDKKLVFTLDFHHINDLGYYAKWTHHKVIVRPGWDGPTITITGPNKNDVKDYLHNVYYWTLLEDFVPCQK